MNTAQSLKEEFGTQFPLLTDVAKKYLALEPSTAKKRAWQGLIPFPFFQVGKSNHAPLLVDVVKLAKYIDEVSK